MMAILLLAVVLSECYSSVSLAESPYRAPITASAETTVTVQRTSPADPAAARRLDDDADRLLGVDQRAGAAFLGG